MLELEEALTRILAILPEPVAEALPLRDAYGRILAARVPAPVDLPAFDNSSVDGYAVRAADVAVAAPESPARLLLAGRVPAGATFAGELPPDRCARVFTGSALPRGADAVVMQEYTRVRADLPEEILVLQPVRPEENIRFQGEDTRQGRTLVDAGESLTAGRLSLLAAVGVTQVWVGRQPRVGLLATGSELKEGGEPLAPGQVYESIRSGLAPLASRAGAIVRTYPLVADESEIMRTALAGALEECDIVLTCGGVSVGETDFVKSAFEQLGGHLEFWKVAMKPGRPFAFGRYSGRLLFGLPGNPVSALVTFLLLARPALLRWQGATRTSLPASPGRLAEPLANPGSRRHFIRVTISPAGEVRSAGLQASHLLNSIAAADGLVDVAPQTTLAAGTRVTVLRWE
jgi:molybdopterin molybdotransferase